MKSFFLILSLAISTVSLAREIFCPGYNKSSPKSKPPFPEDKPLRIVSKETDNPLQDRCYSCSETYYISNGFVYARKAYTQRADKPDGYIGVVKGDQVVCRTDGQGGSAGRKSGSHQQ